MTIQPPSGTTMFTQPVSPPPPTMAPAPTAELAVTTMGETTSSPHTSEYVSAETPPPDFADLAPQSTGRLKLPPSRELPDWNEFADIADSWVTARPTRAMPQRLSSLWGLSTIIAFVGACALIGCSNKAGAESVALETEHEPTPSTFPAKALAVGSSSRVRTPESGPLSASTVFSLKREANRAARHLVRSAFYAKYPKVMCVTRPGLDHAIEIDETSSASFYKLIHDRGFNRYRFFLAWNYAQCMAPGKLAGQKGMQLFRLKNPRL